MKSIILMGIKHCGKSTQARLLARHFAIPAFDTDDEITERTGKTPREIYSVLGKEAFLQAEADACRTLKETVSALKTAPYKAVVATGGGICENKAALDILKEFGIFVFLDIDEESALSRILEETKTGENGQIQNLPAYIQKENPKNLSDVRKIFHGFYAERKKKYGEICDARIELQPASKEWNSQLILSKLKKM